MANGNGNGGWAEYQRLVLAELERHNSIIENIGSKLESISLTLALLKEQNDRQDKKIEENTEQLEHLETRINTVFAGNAVDEAIKKYRKWLLGVGIMLVSSIVIPIIKILFFP
jgi:DNA repair exonuclease SbcCD ATPase subunit